METLNTLTDTERTQLREAMHRLQGLATDVILPDDLPRLRQILQTAAEDGTLQRDTFGLHPILFDLQTAVILAEEIGLNRASLLAVLLHDCVSLGAVTQEQVERDFGPDVQHIIHGLLRVQEVYQKNPSIETENFRDLLLSFAEDMRVIFVIIASRVCLMRQIKERGTLEERQRVAQEASVLYAPLAHKLGLYLIKRELEDLSLKYLQPDVFYMIKDKLAQTRAARDRYIDAFIRPIEERLQETGLHFHVKGRTKSIHSIWQKMQKQKCKFEGIYDLFAIRIILDSPPEREKQDCWQVFSIVTDMYRPNPKRLRDWLSVPKSNGYESLHITVMGPEGRWVEIQIRTERMDEVAERGLAAHWRYKGVKDSGQKLEEWLKEIRSALEHQTASGEQLMNQFKVDLYSDEVFVFTPKGDLFKLRKGATVLDFAFHIHTNVGCHCTGALVNGKNVHIHTRLQTGDQVEILTNPRQQPKRDWLNYAVTTKARNKIRQSLNEQETRNAQFAKEALQRKFKSRKITPDEGVLMRMVKRLGYRQMNDFYRAVSEGAIDPAAVVEHYQQQLDREANPQLYTTENRSADGYVRTPTEEERHQQADILVLDDNLKGIDYTLARCCNPIYGDPVFGFVTAGRGIKIHRTTCPNAPLLRQQMAYRIIPARWAGKGSSQYPVSLHVLGHDDIGIVNNITSIINKEPHITLRGISIQSSDDGLFSGTLTVMTDDTRQVQQLIRKLQTVHGVKAVSR